MMKKVAQVQELVGDQFSKGMIKSALEECNGRVDAAAAFLRAELRDAMTGQGISTITIRESDPLLLAEPVADVIDFAAMYLSDAPSETPAPPPTTEIQVIGNAPLEPVPTAPAKTKRRTSKNAQQEIPQADPLPPQDPAHYSGIEASAQALEPIAGVCVEPSVATLQQMPQATTTGDGLNGLFSPTGRSRRSTRAPPIIYNISDDNDDDDDVDEFLDETSDFDDDVPRPKTRSKPKTASRTSATTKTASGPKARATKKTATAASTSWSGKPTRMTAIRPKGGSASSISSSSSSSSLSSEVSQVEAPLRSFTTAPSKKPQDPSQPLLNVVRPTRPLSETDPEVMAILKDVSGTFGPDGRYNLSSAELYHLRKQEELESRLFAHPDSKIKGIAMLRSQKLLCDLYNSKPEDFIVGECRDVDLFEEPEDRSVDLEDMPPGVTEADENANPKANGLPSETIGFISATMLKTGINSPEGITLGNAIKKDALRGDTASLGVAQQSIVACPVLLKKPTTGGTADKTSSGSSSIAPATSTTRAAAGVQTLTPRKTLGMSRRVGLSPPVSATSLKPVAPKTPQQSGASSSASMKRKSSAETATSVPCCFPIIQASTSTSVTASVGDQVIDLSSDAADSDSMPARRMAVRLIPISTKGSSYSKSPTTVVQLKSSADENSAVCRVLSQALRASPEPAGSAEAATEGQCEETKVAPRSTEFFGLGARTVTLKSEGKTSLVSAPSVIAAQDDVEKKHLVLHLRQMLITLKEAREKIMKKNKSIPTIDPDETRKLEALTYKWTVATQSMLRDLVPIIQQQKASGAGQSGTGGRGYYDEGDVPRRRSEDEDGDYDRYDEDQDREEEETEIGIPQVLRSFNIPPEMVFWNDHKEDFDDPVGLPKSIGSTKP